MGRPRLSHCAKGHPLAGYNLEINNINGKRRCRLCDRARKKKWHAAHSGAINKKRRLWGKTNSNQRRADYKKNYGITLERYDEMFAEQHGLCAISGLPSPTGRNAKTRLNVDHDHATNTVRQLLHPDINTALGLFQDNPEWLRRATDYIERWRKQ